MFTGLIEDVGEILSAERRAGGLRFRIGTRLGGELAAGESISVNGVCLTAIEPSAGSFAADISPATIEVTTLGKLAAGARVNLERALQAGGRFGGHMVLGHVDGVGEITAFAPEGDHHWLSVDVPPALAKFLVQKGSVALDGISLTIARLHGSHAGIQIVPHTLGHTSLNGLRPGDLVNLECDIIGKYVVQTLNAQS
ncbi:MAG: riboflavin synthase [Acidobacteriota bacterium]|nr:riboflavin synthase [Acidobacteriota bacterium]